MNKMENLDYITKYSFRSGECGLWNPSTDLTFVDYDLVEERAKSWNTTFDEINNVVMYEETQHKLLRGRIPLMQLHSLSMDNRQLLYAFDTNEHLSKLTPWMLKTAFLMNEIVSFRIMKSIEPLLEGHVCFLLKHMPVEVISDDVKEKVLKTKLSSEKTKDVYDGLETVYEICDRWYIPHEIAMTAMNFEVKKEENVHNMPVNLDGLNRFWALIDQVLVMEKNNPLNERAFIKQFTNEATRTIYENTLEHQTSPFWNDLEDFMDLLIARAKIPYKLSSDFQITSNRYLFETYKNLDSLSKKEMRKKPEEGKIMTASALVCYKDRNQYYMLDNPDLTDEQLHHCLLQLSAFCTIKSVLSGAEPKCPLCEFNSDFKHSDECKGEMALKKGRKLIQHIDGVETEYLEKIWKDMMTENV